MKHRFLAQIAILLLVLFSPAVSYAQQGMVAEKASELIQEFMAETGAPGIAEETFEAWLKTKALLGQGTPSI